MAPVAPAPAPAVQPLRIEKRGVRDPHGLEDPFSRSLLDGDDECCNCWAATTAITVPATAEELAHWRAGGCCERERRRDRAESEVQAGSSGLGSAQVRVCIHGHLHFSRVRRSDPGARTPTLSLSGRRSHAHAHAHTLVQAQVPTSTAGAATGSRLGLADGDGDERGGGTTGTYRRRASLSSLPAPLFRPSSQTRAWMLPFAPTTERALPLPPSPSPGAVTVPFPAAASQSQSQVRTPFLDFPAPTNSKVGGGVGHGRSSSATVSRAARLRLKSFGDLPLPRKRPLTADAPHARTVGFEGAMMYARDRPPPPPPARAAVKIKVRVLASDDLFAFRLPVARASLRELRSALFVRNAVEYRKLQTLRFRFANAAKWSEEVAPAADVQLPADGIVADDSILQSRLQAAQDRGRPLRLEAF